LDFRLTGFEEAARNDMPQIAMLLGLMTTCR
jgi:hypothetical protein